MQEIRAQFAETLANADEGHAVHCQRARLIENERMQLAGNRDARRGQALNPRLLSEAASRD
jgi:hypothetical protein